MLLTRTLSPIRLIGWSAGSLKAGSVESEPMSITKVHVGTGRKKHVDVQVRRKEASFLDTGLYDQLIGDLVVCGEMNVKS
jgi:hypothetical protein